MRRMIDSRVPPGGCVLLVLFSVVIPGAMPTGDPKDPSTWHMLPPHGAPRADLGAAISPSYPDGLNEDWVVWIRGTESATAAYTDPPIGTDGLLAYDMKPEDFLNATCQQSPGNLAYWRWDAAMSNGPVARNISRNGMCTVATTVPGPGGVQLITTKVVPCTSSCTCPPQHCLVKDITKPSNFSCTPVLYREAAQSYYPVITRTNATHTWQEKSPNATEVLSWGCTKPADSPCSQCNTDIKTCAPHCVRALAEAEYFDSRELAKDQYHYYSIEAMTHDNYCCKYLKHCERNHMFIKAESCNGFVSIYVDVKPYPNKDRHIWSAKAHSASGFVETINLPIYHAFYYVSVVGEHEFPPPPAYNGTHGNFYTFFFKSSAGNRQDNKQIVGNGGKIELDSMATPDPNDPDTKTMDLKWRGMSDPYKRPVKYEVYGIEGLKDPDDSRLLENVLSSECTMKRNGVLLETIPGRSYGLEEGAQEYKTTWTINQQKVYLLNVFAVNDIGIGKPYVTFKSGLPPAMMDIISGDKIYYIIGAVGFFIILVANLMYWGKIRPASQEAAKCKENEKQRLIEIEKNETEHDRIQRVRRENKKKIADKLARERGDPVDEE